MINDHDTDPPTDNETTKPDHPKPGAHHDAEMLRMLHAMVADLCIEFGDKPNDVPCDIWRLHDNIRRLRSDNKTLATMWDRMGSNARAGFSDEDRLAADHARDRTLYPFRNALVTQEKAQEIARQVRQDFLEVEEEVRRTAKELDDWSKLQARSKR